MSNLVYSEVMQIANKDLKCVKNFGKPVKTVIMSGNHSYNALIDSGSDVNLIAAELCSKLFNVEFNVGGLTLTGLGRSQVQSLGKITTAITIDGQCYDGVTFHIIPRDCMPHDVIIGHEFLKGVTMLMNEGCVTIYKGECEWLANVNCISDEKETLLEYIVNPVIRQEVYQCIDTYHPVQVKEAPLQLKIILKDDIPVAQRPRRLSYTEQGIVEKQFDEWLKDGIIRQMKNKPCIA
ncbi:uncharacterized protein LOC124644986 isoform X2 [Helicoverpa zea]|uniref:uncharacterized protein LOC124644986 isoform X2 n=1 Tax=Helicoverpa zea TaxID=7113 RepID=UPI001F57C167|nr:uncharacterized protein LOC124644986 isoform X2 [Helicoverpa zea]